MQSLSLSLSVQCVYIIYTYGRGYYIVYYTDERETHVAMSAERERDKRRINYRSES